MDQSPDTIVCPFCGNVNPFTQENCIKCKKPLGAIREAMGFTGSRIDDQQEPVVPPIIPVNTEPPPQLPDIPEKYLGKRMSLLTRRSLLIRSAGDRGDEIVGRFFKRLNDKNVTGISISRGVLSDDTGAHEDEYKEYFFIDKDIDKRTYASMAIHVAPVGTDLYVEWLNYYYKKPKLYAWWWWIIIPFWGGLVYSMFYDPDRMIDSYELQENDMFQLSIRATLEEAIDLSGISKALIQSTSAEGSKDQRVI